MINWFRSKPTDREATLFDKHAEASSIAAIALVALLDVALALDLAADSHRTTASEAMSEIADMTIIYDLIEDDDLAEVTLVKIERLIDVCEASALACEANMLTAFGIRELLGL